MATEHKIIIQQGIKRRVALMEPGNPLTVAEVIKSHVVTASPDSKDYKKEKEGLPIMLTTTGTVVAGQGKEDYVARYCVVDVDALSKDAEDVRANNETLELYLDDIRELPGVLMTFNSPSGATKTVFASEAPLPYAEWRRWTIACLNAIARLLKDHPACIIDSSMASIQQVTFLGTNDPDSVWVNPRWQDNGWREDAPEANVGGKGRTMTKQARRAVKEAGCLPSVWMTMTPAEIDKGCKDMHTFVRIMVKALSAMRVYGWTVKQLQEHEGEIYSKHEIDKAKEKQLYSRLRGRVDIAKELDGANMAKQLQEGLTPIQRKAADYVAAAMEGKYKTVLKEVEPVVKEAMDNWPVGETRQEKIADMLKRGIAANQRDKVRCLANAHKVLHTDKYVDVKELAEAIGNAIAQGYTRINLVAAMGTGKTYALGNPEGQAIIERLTKTKAILLAPLQSILGGLEGKADHLERVQAKDVLDAVVIMDETQLLADTANYRHLQARTQLIQSLARAMVYMTGTPNSEMIEAMEMDGFYNIYVVLDAVREVEVSVVEAKSAVKGVDACVRESLSQGRKVLVACNRQHPNIISMCKEYERQGRTWVDISRPEAGKREVRTIVKGRVETSEDIVLITSYATAGVTVKSTEPRDVIVVEWDLGCREAVQAMIRERNLRKVTIVKSRSNKALRYAEYKELQAALCSTDVLPPVVSLQYKLMSMTEQEREDYVALAKEDCSADAITRTLGLWYAAVTSKTASAQDGCHYKAEGYKGNMERLINNMTYLRSTFGGLVPSFPSLETRGDNVAAGLISKAMAKIPDGWDEAGQEDWDVNTSKVRSSLLAMLDHIKWLGNIPGTSLSVTADDLAKMSRRDKGHVKAIHEAWGQPYSQVISAVRVKAQEASQSKFVWVDREGRRWTYEEVQKQRKTTRSGGLERLGHTVERLGLKRELSVAGDAGLVDIVYKKHIYTSTEKCAGSEPKPIEGTLPGFETPTRQTVSSNRPSQGRIKRGEPRGYMTKDHEAAYLAKHATADPVRQVQYDDSWVFVSGQHVYTYAQVNAVRKDGESWRSVLLRGGLTPVPREFAKGMLAKREGL